MKLQLFQNLCNWRKPNVAQSLKKNLFKEKISKKKSVRALRDALQLPILRKRGAVIREKGSLEFMCRSITRRHSLGYFKIFSEYHST
jgi:hypothetical protein